MAERQAINQEMEKAIIGSILIRPEILWKLDLSTRDFGDPRAAAAFAGALSLSQDGETIDALTLEKAANFRAVTVNWLLEAMGSVATAESAFSYAKHISELAMERSVRRVAHDIATSGLEGRELLDYAGRRMDWFSGMDVDGTVTAAQAAQAVMDSMSGEGGNVLHTGVWEFDKYCMCDPGDLLVVGGITSMGKSQLLAWMRLRYTAMGERVLVLSTESKMTKVARRDLSMMCGINTRKMVASAGPTTDEKISVQTVAKEYSGLHVWINDQLYDIDDIVRYCRFMRERHGITVFQLDHLQEVGSRDYRGSPRELMNYVISRWRNFGHEGNGVYVQAASQLKRAADRDGKYPRLSDLQESGRIEQSSQVVVFVHRPGYYDGKKDQTELKLLFAKVRDGETGIGDWLWDEHLGQVVGPKPITRGTEGWQSTGAS